MKTHSKRIAGIAFGVLVSTFLLLAWIDGGFTEVEIKDLLIFSLLIAVGLSPYYFITHKLVKNEHTRRYGLKLSASRIRFLRKVGVIPQLTSAYAYVIALSVVGVVVLNYEALGMVYTIVGSYPIVATVGLLLLLAVFGKGFLFSLLSIFPSTAVTESKEKAIKRFVLLVLGVLSIAVPVYSIVSMSLGYLLLVPWHVFQMGVLLSLIQTRHHNPSKYVSFVRSPNTKTRVIVGTGVTLLVLLVAQYVLGLHAVITLSAATIIWSMTEDLMDRISASQNM